MAKRKKRKYGNVLAFISEETKIEAEIEAEKSRERVSIWEIRPDPNQPRRLLPSELAQQFEAGTLSPTDVIIKWAEYRNPAYESLQTLGMSIAQHGQINPISVRSADNSDEVKYTIITGERRWWAHVYLVSENRQINEGETSRSAEQIKVHVTSSGISIRAHQLIENLVREDLNLYEKAQGIWALRYELSNVTHGSHNEANQGDGTHNLDDPANQGHVTHGSHHPAILKGGTHEADDLVPWKVVEESLGISRRHRSRITNVLQLSEKALKLIQLHNLSERMIRPIIQKLRDDPALQLQALNQLIVWQNEPTTTRSLVQGIKEYVDDLLAPDITEPETVALGPSREIEEQATSPNYEEVGSATSTQSREPGKQTALPEQEEVGSATSTQSRELGKQTALPEQEEVGSATSTQSRELGEQMALPKQEAGNGASTQSRELGEQMALPKQEAGSAASTQSRELGEQTALPEQEEVGSATQSEITTTLWTTPQELPLSQEQEQLTVFPRIFEKATEAEDVTNLIMMANAAGANAWRFDDLKFAKLTTISNDGKKIEYEVPRPHEGVVMLMFPEIEEKKESDDPA